MADSTPDGGGELRMLRSMIAQGKEFLAVEPDSDDRAAMEAIISDLTNLLAAEIDEDGTTTVAAVNAANGKSTTRRLLVVPKHSQARFEEAAQRLIERELEAEHESRANSPGPHRNDSGRNAYGTEG